MQFINTSQGVIALSRVIRQYERKDSDGTWQTFVEYEDGHGICTAQTSADVQDTGAPVVPASPGFEAVEVSPDGDAFRTPIVAWRIEAGIARPVTPDDISDAAAVLCPNGMVISPYFETWGSLDLYVRAYKLRHKAA